MARSLTLTQLNKQIDRRVHTGRYNHIIMAYSEMMAPENPSSHWYLNSAAGAIRHASRLNDGWLRDMTKLTARVKIKEARKIRLAKAN